MLLNRNISPGSSISCICPQYPDILYCTTGAEEYNMGKLLNGIKSHSHKSRSVRLLRRMIYSNMRLFTISHSGNTLAFCHVNNFCKNVDFLEQFGIFVLRDDATSHNEDTHWYKALTINKITSHLSFSSMSLCLLNLGWSCERNLQNDNKYGGDASWWQL